MGTAMTISGSSAEVRGGENGLSPPAPRPPT
jgi:hypothetical protein